MRIAPVANQVADNSLCVQRTSALVQPQKTVTVRSCGISRRCFGVTSALGIAAFAMSPLAWAEDSLEQRLDKQYEVLVKSNADVPEFIYELDRLRTLAYEDKSEYIEWYGTKVEAEVLKKDLKRQTVLEKAGRMMMDSLYTCKNCSGMNGEAQEGSISDEEASNFLGSYSQLIKHNDTSQKFLAHALDSIDIVIDSIHNCDCGKMRGSQNDYPILLGNAVLSLYETVSGGVKKLPKIDSSIKGRLFEIPAQVNQNNGSNDYHLQLKMIAALSRNYFGARQYHKDFDGLSIMAKNFVYFSGLTPFAQIPVSFLYAIMDQNPDYFKTAVEGWVKEAKKLSGTPGDDVTYALGNCLEQGASVFRVFGRRPLTQLDAYDCYSGSYEMITEKSRDELREGIKPWSEENIAVPIGEIFLTLLQDRRRASLTVEEKGTARGVERYIKENDWQLLNQCFNQITRSASDKFCSRVMDISLARLGDDFEPFNREMTYQNFGAGLVGVSGDDLHSAYLKELQGRLMYEPFAQGVKGIGHGVARDLMEKHPGTQGWHFIDELEKIDLKKGTSACLNDLSEDSPWTGSEKLILSALRIVSGDTVYAMSLMPERRFPGPTFKRTYELKDGRTVEVEVTHGINYDADKEYKSIGKLIKEEISYTEENKRDGRALHRLWHNAFIFLAYVATPYGNKGATLQSAYSQDNAVKNARRFSNFMIKFLDNSLRFNLLELDGPDYAEHWGEKVSALTELYGVVPYIEMVDGDYNQKVESISGYVINDRMEALGGVFFANGKEAESEKIYGPGTPIFEVACEAKVESKFLGIMQAGMIQGMFNTAGHRGMQRCRETLIHLGGRAGFDLSILQDPYGYIKFVYDIDLKREKARGLEEEITEWRERAAERG